MWNTKLKIFALLFVCQFFITTQSVANEIRIAVASNFYPTMKEVVKQFEIEAFDSSKASKIVLIPGSSGKHYAQIINGAPFDLFFSADKIRPLLLEQQRISKNESRFTYALGKLALWSPIKGLVDSEGQILYDNIAQAFQFISSGNAELGFVSFSQLMSPNFSVRGSFWEVPQSLYNPIEQQAVLLTDSSLGRDFMSFVQTDEALNIISKFGYDLP